MSGVTCSEVTPKGLAYIVRNLRDRDRREIFGLRWNDDEDALVIEVCNVAGDLWRMWYLDDIPVAVCGAVPVRPGVVIVGAFGTKKWKSVLRPMTRWALQFVVPILKMADFHRAEAYVLAANTDSRRWIEMMGGEVESLLKGFGRAREDYLLYVRDLTREEKDDVHLPQRAKKHRAFHAHRHHS